jgi:CS domain
MEIPEVFSYVFIPVVGPAEEQSHARVSLEDDRFIAMVKSHFSRSEASVSAEVLRSQITSNGSKQVAEEMMHTLMNSGVSIDIFSLSLPVAASRYFGVSIYCDDKGIAKNLPVNVKANELARSCGVKNPSFRGDVFVSRVFDDNETEWFRANLTLGDLKCASEWQVQARGLNSKKAPVSLSSLTQNFAEAQSQAGPAGCEWTDEGESVEVRVQIGQAIKKDVDVTIKVNRLQVKLRSETVLDIPLFRKVSPGDSSWVLSDGRVVINLEKSDTNAAWSSLSPE